MAGVFQFSVAGNLAADPELRYTPSGAAVANFTVASTPRRFDKHRGEYVDGETLWVKCVAWRRLAENITESVAKGMPVVMVGELAAKSWDAADGARRTSWELTVEAGGPDLSTAVATVHRPQYGGGKASHSTGSGAGQSSGFPGVPDPEESGARAQQPAASRSAPQPRGDGGSGWGPVHDEPPF